MVLRGKVLRCIGLLIVLLAGGCDQHDPRRGDVNYGLGSVNLDDLYSYQSDGPYSNVLKRCVAIRFAFESCTLNTLPLLGQERAVPSVSDVMKRLAVSHAWMGDNFRLVLESMPDDVLLLLRSVTAIVIDADIKPAFYDPTTGAIYLDPDFLWLTVTERATLPSRSDFRENYGRDLQFVDLWRYVRNNDWAWSSPDPADNIDRTLTEIRLPFARLLYHELAHANDMAPVDLIATFSGATTIYQAINAIGSQWLSTQLIASYPLHSDALKQIAQVKFNGQPSTAEQRAYSPADVGSLFQSDGADMLYNYTTPHEDFALLFEETMMKYHFDAELDVAFTNNPAGEQLSCDDYQVAWGQRNRIASPLVTPRAQNVATQLLPGTDWSTFFSSDVGTTIQMPAGGWCENLVQGSAAVASRSRRVTAPMVMPEENLRPPH